MSVTIQETVRVTGLTEYGLDNGISRSIYVDPHYALGEAELPLVYRGFRLSPQSARLLAQAILAAVEKAEAVRVISS